MGKKWICLPKMWWKSERNKYNHSKSCKWTNYYSLAVRYCENHVYNVFPYTVRDLSFRSSEMILFLMALFFNNLIQYIIVSYFICFKLAITMIIPYSSTYHEFNNGTYDVVITIGYHTFITNLPIFLISRYSAMYPIPFSSSFFSCM